MAEDLAARIEADIMARGWPIADSLGSEASLIEHYGVSRAVFREAIRIVEHHGAARMRRGPGGGLVVAAPDPAAVEQPAMLFLDYANVSAQDLYDVRSALELVCVRIATEQLDEAGITRLRAVLEDEAETGGELADTGRAHDLHVVIAELTGNAAMRLFVRTLTRLTFERAGRQQYTPTELREVHRAHVAIAEAIIAGDAGLAQHRMSRHLAAGLAYYQQRVADGGNDSGAGGFGRAIDPDHA